MKSKEQLDKIISEITKHKEALRDNFSKHPEEVFNFYNSLKGLNIDSLKKLFYAPKAVVEQNIFDITSEIISADAVDALRAAILPFRPGSIKKTSPENFKKDMQLLQGVFFFLLRDICETGMFFAPDKQKSKIKELFDSALNENLWYLPEKLSEILNKISLELDFLRTNPFTDIDFTKFEGNYFKANESILRILANFIPPENEAAPREKLINVINFVREQQKKILPVFPNTKKSDYSDASANDEIAKADNNLEKLKHLDFGFKDSNFTQMFFINDEQLNKNFTREITCKFFQESAMRWKEGDPRKTNRGKELKILARKNDRFTNKAALHTKFLYPERNAVTHISENFAVFTLFGKEYSDSQMSYWKKLILYAFFDSYKYLCELKEIPAQQETAEKLLAILEHYLKKTITPLDLGEINGKDLWRKVFNFENETENLDLKPDALDKINIYNNDVLDEDEIFHLKKFIGFLCCSENEKEDFFIKNTFAIQIYLIYLTFELAKMDRYIEKHK